MQRSCLGITIDRSIPSPYRRQETELAIHAGVLSLLADSRRVRPNCLACGIVTRRLRSATCSSRMAWLRSPRSTTKGFTLATMPRSSIVSCPVRSASSSCGIYTLVAAGMGVHPSLRTRDWSAVRAPVALGAWSDHDDRGALSIQILYVSTFLMFLLLLRLTRGETKKEVNHSKGEERKISLSIICR